MPQQLAGALTSNKMPALVLNVVCFGFPPLAFAALMVPTAISDYHWQRVVVKEWPAFQHRYHNQTELSREMLVDAQKSPEIPGNTAADATALVQWHFSPYRQPSCILIRPEPSMRQPKMVYFKEERASFTSSPTQVITGSAEKASNRRSTSFETRQAESAGKSVREMGQQAAQKVVTYFTVQCACILVGGICMQVLAGGVAFTHYSQMEKQSRLPVLAMALSVCCYITLSIGAINLASAVYDSFEKSFSVLLQANVSAKTRRFHCGAKEIAEADKSFCSS
ncbi:unnamed protein product [Tilletia controversa]|uniref:Transmembrane protein n=1 Tax=Tilletia laevis TaxID=157183 RepID=A0A9N8QGQ1_9BASI|nr:unnamed protein product [Tilletia caries]CAD6927981.1 unnamed protein product [Tilletia laevis]CAD6938528.1 unnamed protein product [Tilletia laevis]CAD6957016.1 unnamed protein product [Tilletia controversa]